MKKILSRTTTLNGGTCNVGETLEIDQLRTQPWRNIYIRTFSWSVTKWLVVVAAAALLIAGPFHTVAYGQTTRRWIDGNGDWNTAANLWSSGAPNVTTTTWTDGNGDWNTAANWDNGVPTSTTNAVINGTGHTVSLSAAGSTNNLTLASGNTLNIVNALSLTVSGTSISDSGTINLSSAGNLTELIINNANTTLSGTGTLTLGNNSQNVIFGSVGADILTNQSTIQGSGNIGDTQMTLVNSGTIDANSGAGSNTLFIDTSGGTTNTGTLEATNSSALQITAVHGGNVTNTGGIIQATGGGLVQLTGGVVITGGTLTTNTGGAIQGIGTATLSGLTISTGSSYQVNNATITFLGGTITNNGTLTMASAGNQTSLELSGNVTLTGTGNVTMSNNTQNVIFGTLGTNTLTNNETIQGSGNIGDTQMTLVNSATGIIDANNGGGNALIIQTSGGTTNTGTLEATSGATLVLEGASGGNFTNTGGTIKAVGSGSLVELENGVTITGGTLTTSGGGLIFSNNSATLSGLTLSTGSNYQLNNATSTTLVGTMTNNGTIKLASAGNATDLILSGNVTLTGTGVVTMSNNTQNFIFGGVAADILTNNQTIQGSGNIGDGQMALVNSATGIIDANSGGGSNPLIIQTSGGTTNNGILEATAGSNLVLEGASGGNFTNTGATIQAVGSGSTVQLNNGVTITGGTLTSSGGGLIFTATSATLSGLTLSTGSNYQLNNAATTTLVGTMTNNGTITMASAGNATDLRLSGNVMLTGTGVVTMSNNSQNFIFGNAAANILTNQETIQGSGNIGDGQMALVNSGTIDANSGAGSNPLIIQVSNGATNTNTLEATNSSALVLNGGTFTNTGGTIEALGNGAAVELENGVTITGGTLTSTGTGVIESLNSAKLSGVTLSTGSNYLVPNATNTTLVSRLTNNGTFTLASAGNATELLISGNVSLSGRGAVVMSNNSQNFIFGVASTAVLTNNSTIEGSGNIGDNFMGLVNGTHGVINANNGAGSNPLLIDVDTKNFNNQGTLIVGAGSVMTIGGGSGSFLNMNTGTSTLTGGTYNVTGTLNFAAGSNGILTDAANITLSGTSAEIFNTTNSTNALTNLNTIAASSSFQINSGANFTTTGNFTNNGTLTVGSSNSTFDVNGNLSNFSGTTLTGGTYNVTGTLQFNNANIVTNAANITLSGTTSRIIDQSSANGLANFATNNGSFTLAGNRSFTTAGNFANAGTFTINTGSTFTLGGSGIFTQSAGTTTDDGSLSASSGGVSLNGGSLFGKGSITGALTSSSAATITPGDSATKTGILRDTGAYTQNSGTLDISINGTTAGSKFDQLNPTTASLSGTLNISRPTGFVPGIGNTFKIMNFTSETGTFATVTGLAINNTEHFTLTYQPTDVLLTVVAGPVVRHPATPSSGKRAQSVINVRDSGELLSMLDRAVPGSDGRLTVSHHNRMNDTGKTDRINVDRMMRADRGMADIRRMRERGVINPRGTRAF